MKISQNCLNKIKKALQSRASERDFNGNIEELARLAHITWAENNLLEGNKDANIIRMSHSTFEKLPTYTQEDFKNLVIRLNQVSDGTAASAPAPAPAPNKAAKPKLSVFLHPRHIFRGKQAEKEDLNANPFEKLHEYGDLSLYRDKDDNKFHVVMRPDLAGGQGKPTLEQAKSIIKRYFKQKEIPSYDVNKVNGIVDDLNKKYSSHIGTGLEHDGESHAELIQKVNRAYMGYNIPKEKDNPEGRKKVYEEILKHVTHHDYILGIMKHLGIGEDDAIYLPIHKKGTQSENKHPGIKKLSQSEFANMMVTQRQSWGSKKKLSPEVISGLIETIKRNKGRMADEKFYQDRKRQRDNPTKLDKLKKYSGYNALSGAASYLIDKFDRNVLGR